MKKSIFILLFALLGVLSARAYDFEVDGIYYNILSGTTDKVEVTHGDDSYTGSVVIPSRVTYDGNTYTVTAIGEWAFGDIHGVGLTSVTIPNSVTSIGECAFSHSDLTSITIPESVTTIGDEAFSYTSIRSPLYNSKIFAYLPRNYRGEYTIPDGIQSIAGYAFGECKDLTLVTLPNSVTAIGHSAFAYCNALRSITLPESLERIAFGAFYECVSLVSVTSLATTPPRRYLYDTDVDIESVFYVYSGTLYVPQGCKAAYDTAQEWHKFAKIEEISGAGTATVKAQVNDAAMGTVTKGGEYALGETVPLVAIAYQGYEFVRWDDGNTNNPRLVTVEGDVTLTAIFAKNNPDNPDNPTANENSATDNFRVYVQNRTIYLSENRGAVQVYNVAGQCVYNGHATAIPVSQSGTYIVVVGSQRFKVPVR